MSIGLQLILSATLATVQTGTPPIIPTVPEVPPGLLQLAGLARVATRRRRR